MAQTSTRPQLVSPRAIETLEAVRSVTSGGTFDPDMWHVINARDTDLIADEIAHGVGSPIFVYQFDIAGHPVSGISTKGSQYLAQEHGGLKHKIISALEKRGTIISFQRFESGEGPPIGYTSLPGELADEPDFYSVVVEVTDIKTGNSVQVERREQRFEARRDRSLYERPNFQTIAQSKARRNAYLILIPQAVQVEFLQRMLKLPRNTMDLTPSLIDEKRGNILRYAAQQGIALDRGAVHRLTLDQISGLGDAARLGQLPAFVQSARALGLAIGGEVAEEVQQQLESGQAAGDDPQAGAATPRRRGRPPGPRQQQQQPSDEGEKIVDTGEPEQSNAAEQDPAAGGQAAPPRRVNFEV
jgi:hypothetical protein